MDEMYRAGDKWGRSEFSALLRFDLALFERDQWNDPKTSTEQWLLLKRGKQVQLTLGKSARVVGRGSADSSRRRRGGEVSVGGVGDGGEEGDGLGLEVC